MVSLYPVPPQPSSRYTRPRYTASVRRAIPLSLSCFRGKLLRYMFGRGREPASRRKRKEADEEEEEADDEEEEEADEEE